MSQAIGDYRNEIGLVGSVIAFIVDSRVAGRVLQEQSTRGLGMMSGDAVAADARVRAGQLRSRTERTNVRRQKSGDGAWQLPDRRRSSHELAALPL
jgi:hypothetical protein